MHVLSTAGLLAVIFAASASASSINADNKAQVLMPGSSAALNPGCKPGGNFDLSMFRLELPFAKKDGGDVQTIPGPQLSPSAPCNNGYENRAYFFTETGDGAMVMRAPGNATLSGCKTWSESSHCRTELGETSPWSSSGTTNKLTVTLLGKAGGNTCIGQVFNDDRQNLKPLLELYYTDKGVLQAGIATKFCGNTCSTKQEMTTFDSVPFGTKFTYELSVANKELFFALNGGPPIQLKHKVPMPPKLFFKAGNYNQESRNVTSEIHVFALHVSHS